MNKLITASAILTSVFSQGAYALGVGDTLLISPAITQSSYYGTPIVSSGSYFSMDTNGDGIFRDNEKIGINPGDDGGIVIGKVQPADINQNSCTSTINSGLIDEPWCFFGNAGAHQTLDRPITVNADGTLDFTGWSVTWNMIPVVNLGGAPDLGDTGMATITCSTPACATGDSYVLDYTAHVPLGDPSGFGGIYYGLHLEGFIGVATPFIDVALDIEGGVFQECSMAGGSSVHMTAIPTLPDDDSVSSIEWTINGQPAGVGADISHYLTLGNNTIEVLLTTINGGTDTISAVVRVNDTTPPIVSADFINRLNGMSVTELQRFNMLKIKAGAVDVCDPEPIVEAMIGAPVNNNDSVFIMKYFGNVSLNLSKIDLSVRATDNQGNSSKQTATINIQ